MPGVLAACGSSLLERFMSWPPYPRLCSPAAQSTSFRVLLSLLTPRTRYARNLLIHRHAVKCFIDLELGSESRRGAALPGMRCVSRTAAIGHLAFQARKWPGLKGLFISLNDGRSGFVSQLN